MILSANGLIPEASQASMRALMARGSTPWASGDDVGNVYEFTRPTLLTRATPRDLNADPE
jgi:hypothetical protein